MFRASGLAEFVASYLSKFLEVEVCQVHVPAGKDMNGQKIFPRRKAKARDVSHDVPVMPLSPGDWIGSVEGGNDG